MKDPNPSSRDEEVRIVFARCFKPIRLAFVSWYRLTEEEADKASDALYGWFYRLNCRVGSSERSPALYGDPVLLVANACQLGREFQLWKLHGRPCRDDGLKAILERDPQHVAVEILSKSFRDQR